MAADKVSAVNITVKASRRAPDVAAGVQITFRSSDPIGDDIEITMYDEASVTELRDLLATAVIEAWGPARPG